MTTSGSEKQVHEAHTSRDEFLSIAAHELRSPMTALGLVLERLLRRAKGRGRALCEGPDEELIQGLEQGLRQVERVSLLIQNLLDVSRIRTGKLELELERFDLASLVREMIDARRDFAARAGSDLLLSTCEPVDGLWDRTRLEQVMSNLLSNAVKYGEGKPIEVALSRSSDGQRARLRVLDKGVGIPAADQARIFEPFERAASAWKSQSLGLGLYIASAIVAAHEGSIRVESAPGAGSAFLVELPVKLPRGSDGQGGDGAQGQE